MFINKKPDYTRLSAEKNVFCIEKKTNTRAVLLLVFIILPLLSPKIDAIDFSRVKDRLAAKYPQLPMTNVTELRAELSHREYILLDVRKEEEYAVSHLRKAHHAPNIKAALLLLQGQDKEAPIITYCSLGYRSAELAAQLKEHGYTNIRNLAGSLFEWVEYDYPVYRDGEKVKEVHPFNLWWGRYLRSDYHKKP